MFLFSEYLRELITKNGITISALARQTGIERTTLSKVLAGQRVLSYSALDSIIAQLRLTPMEEKSIRDFYEMQFEQEGLQESRAVIDKMFSDLKNLDFAVSAFEERKLLMDIDQYVRNRSIFSGDMNVRSLLRMVLSEELLQEEARIEMMIPPNYNFLNEELLQRYLAEGINADVTQIITFDIVENAKEVNLHNLRHFCQILPYCLLSYQRYHPYYYYDGNVQQQYADPFPYFLVTHNCVICLAENGQEAMLLRSEDQVLYYHRHFQTLLTQCHSLIQYTVNPVDVLSSYSKCTDAEGFYMIMDQPCFGRFYTEEFIEAHIHQELPGREYLVAAAQKRFEVLRNGKDFYTLFTKGGLQRFKADGTLDDFPAALVKPFTPEVRRHLMLEMANKTASGEMIARVMESEVFPDYLSMTTSVHSGVGFFLTQQSPIKGDFFSIYLREPSLCRAFHGWLLNLANSRRVLSAEDTAKMLRVIAKNELT